MKDDKIENVEKQLLEFIHNFDVHFNNMDSKESNKKFKLEIDKLWKYITSISDIKDNSLFNKFSTKSQLYTRIRKELMSNQDYYEKIVESEDAKKLLTSSKTELTEKTLKKHLSDYNVSGLELAQYDINLIDNLNHLFETFVMVGCGSLSYTMLDFSLRHPNKKCVGIDVERMPIKDANELKKKFKISNIQYERINGTEYDYSSSGKCLIFVASLVKPKVAVLNQIASTAVEGSIVIVRNPVDFCSLLYEYADYRDIGRLTPLKGKDWEAEANKEHLQLLSAFKIGK